MAHSAVRSAEGRRLMKFTASPTAPSTDAPADSPITKKEETSHPPVAESVIFGGPLGELVDLIDSGKHTEADPVGVFATLLSGTGVLIGPTGPHVMIGSIRHPLLIWPLLFGSTGTGRKGESEGVASLFLNQGPGFKELRASGLSTGEGLIERIRDVVDEDDDGGTEDKRLFLVEPEFAAVLARTKRDGNTLAAVLRQAWDGGALSVLNRKAYKASSSHIGLVAHVTPREFRMKLAESDMSGGSYNRYLPLYVDRAKRLPIPDPISEDVIAVWGARLAGIVTKARNEASANIIMSPGARALWSDSLYDEFSGTDDADEVWTEFVRRAAPYCLRIAGLHAVIDGRGQISREDLEAAGALVRYSVHTARYVLDRQARDPRLERVRRAVVVAGDVGLSRAEVSALFSRNLPKKALVELLDQLTESDDFKIVERSTGGRPATHYVHVSSYFVTTEEAS